MLEICYGGTLENIKEKLKKYTNFLKKIENKTKKIHCKILNYYIL